MSNDWMHGVLVKEPSDDKIKVLASLIIGSEICLSAGSLIYYQANNNSACTMFSVYTLLYAVMCLSNATKNQRTCFQDTCNLIAINSGWLSPYSLLQSVKDN